MSKPTPRIQLQFLKNIQRLLSEERFTASYKYALLLSLADVAVERGDDSGEALTIPTNALAEKFIQYYWRQSLPYLPRGRSRDGKVLQQNTDRQAKIITVLGDAHQTHGGSLSAAKRDAKAWKSLVSQVDQVVRGMPLWKLQTVGNDEFDFLHENVGIGKTVELKTGVAFCLRQFHGLIGDLVRGAWVRFIRGTKQNQDALGTTVDLYEFLFGSDRASLNHMVPILTEIQKGSCGNGRLIDTSTPRIFRYKIEWVGGLAFFLGGSIFTAGGVWMIVCGENGGWLIAAFFGLIPCICLLRLLPNCAFLRVSRRGVEFRVCFRSVLFPWDEIESFDYNSLNDPTREFVELVLADSAPDAGERIPVPPVYGIMPMILANFLNDWRQAIIETGIRP